MEKLESEPGLRPLQLVVNGEAITRSIPPDRRLLDFLRLDLGLTGTKEGCGSGECGACTVLMDGSPVNACLMRAWEAHGHELVTVEGIGDGEQLHRVQQAFIAKGAVQCGFCTPGMVLTAVALLERDPDPDEATIRDALSSNVCRCTGYQQLVGAIQLAAGEEPIPSAPHRIGERAPKEDARDKVTGATRYTDDLPLAEGTLHAAVVRSTRVHARIIAVELADALATDGVVDAFGHEAVPGEKLFGNAVADQPVLAIDRVRFVGEAIAVVVASSREAALTGRDRVEVEYEDLPAVTDPVAALEPDAPQLHPDGNLLTHQTLSRGEVDAAIAGATTVLESTYRTTWQEHLYLEPEVAQADPDGDGGVVVRCPSQNVFFDRLHVCRALNLPRDKVRVIQQPTGAAFGGREDIYAQTHAALAAVRNDRPVRLLWTREETQIASTKRHPVTATYRAGLDAEGRIVGLKVSVLADTGAYASWGPNISRKALVHAAGPFALDHVEVDVRTAYTNNGISGAFRGFGATQVTFGYGSFAAELARACGLDHVEFLRRNQLIPGDITATGHEIVGRGLQVCLDRALEAAGPPPADDADAAIVRGRGLATIFYGIGYGNAIPDIGSAVVELAEDGVIEVRCGAIDYGQGSRTVFLQIVGEVLGLDAAQVRIITGDTHATPDSGSTVASRQTVVSGSAVYKAAVAFRRTMIQLAAETTGRDAGGMAVDGRGAVAGDEVLADWPALAAALTDKGGRRGKQARYRLKSGRLDLESGQGAAYGTYAFGCQLADVAIDTRTGGITVERIVAAHDIGRAINPTMVEGQIIGAVAMGLGFALSEQHRIEDGIPMTRNLDSYRLQLARDVPPVVPVLVEEPDPNGPFGARGVGEPAMVGVAPAVANAIEDAIGVRLRELPLTGEKIWEGERRKNRRGRIGR